MNSGVFQQNKDKDDLNNQPSARREKRSHLGMLPFSNSETTIYRNLLDKTDDFSDNDDKGQGQDVVTQQVDQEITFRLKKNRGSSSSEDHVNTSDELINIDCDKFIADCADQAARQTEPRPDTQNEVENPFRRGEQMIEQAEST